MLSKIVLNISFGSADLATVADPDILIGNADHRRAGCASQRAKVVGTVIGRRTGNRIPSNRVRSSDDTEGDCDRGRARTTAGMAVLEMLEHGMRREGLDAVINRLRS